MIICCDIDGVLADVRSYAKKYLPPYGKQDWKEYFLHTGEFPAIGENILLVKALILTHHPVYFVTGRPESNREATEAWLRRYLMTSGKLSNLLKMRQNKDPRSTSEIKMEYFRKLAPDLLIDDDPEVITLATELGYHVLQVHGYRWTRKKDLIPPVSI